MSGTKKHPWRPCPLGQHWVREHARAVPVSEDNPDGVTKVDGHCRKNPSRHEIFVVDEIHEISSNHFEKVKKKPKPDSLGFPNGNEFDDFIAGWTEFWNEIFKPEESLDPNLVKALVASESGFQTGIEIPSKAGRARGLVQITEQARKVLGNQEGELKDFLITISKKDSTDPNVNICAAIRWLFHKRYLASHRLKREATWLEAIAEYKGILNQLGEVQLADRIMRDIENYYKRLQIEKGSENK